MTNIILLGLLLLGAVISYFVIRNILVSSINKLFVKTKTDLDDVLVKHQVFHRLAYLVPGWIVYKLAPALLIDFPSISNMVAGLVAIYMVLMATMAVSAIIDSLLDIYSSLPIAKKTPIKNFAQVAKLIIYFVAFIGITSILLGESPLKLFAGLGAMTAVLMLVFKDPILGFVAGLQLSYNEMVAIGDWVDIPQHNASGDILEIGLTTVKVQNFDNTVTTVPTQSLINESFKNWRGMQESPGRRIKRAIHIDLNSIRFCDQDAIERYSKIDYIKEYIESKYAEVERFNKENVSNPDSVVNGRRLSNVGTFRAYIQAYLHHHPYINQNLTLLVRQLPTGELGLPIEIYAFSSEKNWAKYESIQADIFDHLFSVAAEFDLRIFQKPSGLDLREFRSSDQPSQDD